MAPSFTQTPVNGDGDHKELPNNVHALLIPHPCQGHITPMMEFAKRLASLGVTTSLATIDTFVATMTPFFPTITSPHSHIIQSEVRVPTINNAEAFVSVMGFPDGLPPECDRTSFNPDFANAIQNHLEGALIELVHSLMEEGRPVTCLIGDFFLSWIPHLAEVVNLPEVVFWPANASCFSAYAHLDAMAANGYNPFKNLAKAFGPKEAMEKVDCIPGLPPLHPSELPFETRIGEVGLQWVENLMTSRFLKLPKAVAILANTFNELESAVCNALGSNFYAIGPLIPCPNHANSSDEDGASRDCMRKVGVASLSLWKEDEGILQWLDQQPPKSVVYVSFGSLTYYSKMQIQELARGIAASKQRFVWVIRKNLVVRGPEEEEEEEEEGELLPEGFWEKVGDKGRVISWAPQSLVLAHPSVGGFFSHCGWNSCVESLTCGVPVLGWPYMMDQVTNCWLMCNHWRVGLKVQTNTDNYVSQTDVDESLRLLMDNVSLRDPFPTLQPIAQLNALFSTTSSSHTNLERFARVLRNLCSS